MRTVGISLTMALSLLLAQAGSAQECCEKGGCGSENCCARCGAQGPCMKKTCQLVCGVEKVKKYAFEVKCEEFCPLLPRCGGRSCDCCDGKGCETCCKLPRGAEKCATPRMVEPKCGHTRCKKTLTRKEYECEIPSYKCVVVYLCPRCACQGDDSTAAPAAPPPAVAPVPAPPAPIPSAPLPPGPKQKRAPGPKL
jgi:hypothetical protein